MPWYQNTSAAKIIASVTQMALQVAASRYLIEWALRLRSPRSRLNINKIKAENPIHNQVVLFIEETKITLTTIGCQVAEP